VLNLYWMTYFGKNLVNQRAHYRFGRDDEIMRIKTNNTSDGKRGGSEAPLLLITPLIPPFA
ncbi:MAG: hypothetical protein AAF202_06560, partial [Pseudomonadota bacterium]